MTISFINGAKFSFDVNVKGENTGMAYTGRFVMKLFLTLKQRSALAVEYSKRDVGNEKDEIMSAVIRSVCELQAHCEEAPAWFKGDGVWDLVDIQPIVALREKLEEALEQYAKELDK